MLSYPSLLYALTAATTTTLMLTTTTTVVVHAQQNIDLVTCTPVGEASNFNIQLVDMGDTATDPRYIDALEKAAERWSKVIVGDLPDLGAGQVQDWFQGTFSRSYNGAVDDVVIGYDLAGSIDGLGGTLGRAGGVFVRTVQGRSTTTISGIMQFDAVDLDRMPIDDVKAIILHEMGHVLGLVGTNGGCTSACDPQNSSQQGVYQCQLATDEYQALAPGELLFLENRGGLGTACGHWEEDTFRTGVSSEIMTGFFEANLFQPLSLVTVAAIDDIEGYEVDYCGADVWPADENTIKRYEVFRTEQDMDTSAMTSVVPEMGMDEDGVAWPLASGGTLPSLGSIATILAVVNLGIIFFQ